MPLASHAVSRLRKTYRLALLRARASADGPFGYHPLMPAVRLAPAIEQLEPRLLLSNWSGDIPDGTVWPSGVVQVITANARIPLGSTLTIQPGAIVKVSRHYNLTVDGVVLARGTAGSHIVFTSYYDDSVGGNTDGGSGVSSGTPADWGGIAFNNASSPSILDYADVSYGGYMGIAGMMTVSNGGQLTLTHSTLSDSAGYALVLTSASPTITNDTFRNNNTGYYSGAIVMGANCSPALAGLTFTNNTINGVLVGGGSSPSHNITWNSPDVVYVLGGNLIIDYGITLTIGAGQIVVTVHGILLK